MARSELNFDQLHAFVTAARFGNFTSAAAELKVSQSTLSRAVQKLEHQIGQPLFERKPREVTLTETGERFLPRARQILDLIDVTYAELAESNKTGRVRLGVIPTIAPFFLPTILQSFSEKYPHISVRVQEDTTTNLPQRCDHGDIDFAILALPVTTKYLEITPLFDEELVVVVPVGHSLEKWEALKLKDTEAFPFVMLSEKHCLSDQISSFCRSRSVQPVSIEETAQLATVQELVSLGHGISIVPQMAQRLDQSTRRRYLRIADDPPFRTVALAANPYRFTSPWMENFRSHLLKLCDGMVVKQKD